jgi:hypothetical protein
MIVVCRRPRISGFVVSNRLLIPGHVACTPAAAPKGATIRQLPTIALGD